MNEGAWTRSSLGSCVQGTVVTAQGGPRLEKRLELVHSITPLASLPPLSLFLFFLFSRTTQEHGTEPRQEYSLTMAQTVRHHAFLHPCISSIRQT